MPMTDAPVKIPDWAHLYQDSLSTEILRSERRRVTILAVLFAVAAVFYSSISFVPGLLDAEFRARFQSRWPWIISLYAAMVAYELALRAGIGWLLEHSRQPHAMLRYVNAFFETSIPTLMLFMAVSLMGPRDALGSPTFLLYFFFILLSILRLEIRLCLFTGLVAAVEHFIFAYVAIARSVPEVGRRCGAYPLIIFPDRLCCLWRNSSPGCSLNRSGAKSKARYTRYWSAIARFASSVNTSRRRWLRSCLDNRSNWPANCASLRNVLGYS